MPNIPRYAIPALQARVWSRQRRAACVRGVPSRRAFPKADRPDVFKMRVRVVLLQQCQAGNQPSREFTPFTVASHSPTNLAPGFSSVSAIYAYLEWVNWKQSRAATQCPGDVHHCTGMGWNRYATMNPTMTRNSSNAATSTIRLRSSIDVLPSR
jgi:hypothetical protein